MLTVFHKHTSFFDWLDIRFTRFHLKVPIKYTVSKKSWIAIKISAYGISPTQNARSFFDWPFGSQNFTWKYIFNTVGKKSHELQKNKCLRYFIMQGFILFAIQFTRRFHMKVHIQNWKQKVMNCKKKNQCLRYFINKER